MTYDATITIVGKDQASTTIDAATKNILNNYKVMRQEVKSTTAEFALQNQTLVAAQGVFRSVGQVAGSLMNIYTQFQTQQIRVTDANNQLILAQLNYNQVLAQQGPGTNDAIAAAIQLSEAKTNVAQATQQETIGYIGMAFELGSTVSLMIGSIPKIQQFIKSLQAAKTAATEVNAVSTATNAASTATSTASTVASTAKTVAPTVAAGGGIIAMLSKAIPTLFEGLSKAVLPAAITEYASQLFTPTAGGGESTSAIPETGTGQIALILNDIWNKITGGGSSGSTPSGQVQHVVTVQIQNATDNKISTIESSMGIQQVMQSNP